MMFCSCCDFNDVPAMILENAISATFYNVFNLSSRHCHEIPKLTLHSRLRTKDRREPKMLYAYTPRRRRRRRVMRWLIRLRAKCLIVRAGSASVPP